MKTFKLYQRDNEESINWNVFIELIIEEMKKSFISSGTPEGSYKIKDLYINQEGKVVVEYDDIPI